MPSGKDLWNIIVMKVMLQIWKSNMLGDVFDLQIFSLRLMF